MHQLCTGIQSDLNYLHTSVLDEIVDKTGELDK